MERIDVGGSDLGFSVMVPNEWIGIGKERVSVDEILGVEGEESDRGLLRVLLMSLRGGV